MLSLLQGSSELQQSVFSYDPYNRDNYIETRLKRSINFLLCILLVLFLLISLFALLCCIL